MDKDEMIIFLWKLLDDISTAGDMFKPEINGYFKYVNTKCEDRCKVATSDGYKILIKEEQKNCSKCENFKEGYCNALDVSVVGLLYRDPKTFLCPDFDRKLEEGE